jgi:protein gp37
MLPEWVIQVQQQCAKSAVPFFFKQWGGVNKKKAGRELNGRTYDELPRLLAAPKRQQHAFVVL